MLVVCNPKSLIVLKLFFGRMIKISLKVFLLGWNKNVAIIYSNLFAFLFKLDKK